VTTRHGIVIMDSREQMLSSSRTLSVAITRIADQPTLVVDSAPRLERTVGRNSAEKTTALEIYRDMSTPDRQQQDKPEIDGVTRFTHNEEAKLEKKDFEKERDYARELKKQLGIEKMTEARSRDRGMGMGMGIGMGMGM
jgi:hypothetical protein